MKAVLFDLDDTLLDTLEAKWACHKAVAKRYWDIDLSDALLKEHWGKPMSVLISHLYDPSASSEERLEAYLSTTDDFPKGVYDNSVATVHSLLDAHLQVGVVTSAREALARQDLLRHGFDVDRLCILQGEESHPVHKPDPAVFLPAIELLATRDIDVSETAYVGDSLLDARAALGAGLTFVGVTTGLHTAEQLRLAGATHLVDDIGQVPGLIL